MEALCFRTACIFLLSPFSIAIPMKNAGLEKSKVYRGVDIIAHVPGAIVMKTLFQKITGNVSILAISAGESFFGKHSPFDTLVQVIEGCVEIVIDDETYELQSGELMIIPAHSLNRMNAPVAFKLLATVIKSGYEEII